MSNRSPSSGPTHWQEEGRKEEWAKPWRELFSRVPQIVRKLDEAGTSIISIEVDGGVARRLIRPTQKDLEEHAQFGGMPSVTTEEWLLEALIRVGRDYPEPKEKIEVYAYTTLVAAVRA